MWKMAIYACTSHGCNGACWESAARRLGASSCGVQKEGVSWARSSQRSAFGEEALEEGLQQTREGLSLYFQLSLSALQLSSFTLESSSSTVVHKRGSGTGQGGQRLRITSKTGDRARLALRSLGLSEFLIYLPDAYLRQLMNRGTRIGEKSSK